jgi:hypothetical protein
MSPIVKPWYHTTLAGALYAGGRVDEAVAAIESIANEHHSIEALMLLAASFQSMGLTRRAQAAVHEITTAFPAARRNDLSRVHPFRDRSMLDRWLADLEAAGLP